MKQIDYDNGIDITSYVYGTEVYTTPQIGIVWLVACVDGSCALFGHNESKTTAIKLISLVVTSANEVSNIITLAKGEKISYFSYSGIKNRAVFYPYK